MDTILNECKENMEKSISTFSNNLNTLRTGRANASAIENVKCDYYGEMTNITDIAAVKVPEPRQLLIIPYDEGDVKTIVAGLNNSTLGINPVVDGKQIRLNFPALTEDRRKELAKKAKIYSEECKVSIRNVRRDIMDKVKKDDSFTEDTRKKEEAEIQKITDESIKKVDEVLKKKTDEIMTV